MNAQGAPLKIQRMPISTRNCAGVRTRVVLLGGNFLVWR
jgi:hypothetical protein